MDIVLSSFAPIALKLLQGPLYSDEKSYWSKLLQNKSILHEYFGRIGLLLVIVEADGFAYLKQPIIDETESDLPRLMTKRNMNYETTLLAVLLREVLEEFDVKEENPKLFLTKKEIKERIEIYYKEDSNKSKLWKDLSKPIGALEQIGILKQVQKDEKNEDDTKYEVKRMVKALIDIDKLEEIKLKMETYVSNPVQ